ncbi:MAG: molybdopterin molybdotransferase MoeA [Deltaproteobacteria bacterium]|nr:molybdopterin molybdotransferase MoeA [Deltaproteobacteria bacterium]
MKTVKEAQEAILEHTLLLGEEEVPLHESLGRILFSDITSNRFHPPCDISAMDGYAVRFADIDGATKEKPAVLKIVDDITAGSMPKCEVKSNEASRIMTGAPIPEGADTVIRVEDTDCNESEAKIFVPSPIASNIRGKGENLKEDELVLTKGTSIGPPELGTLAMVKRAMVPVYKRPSIAVLSTGDELEALDEPLDPMKIPDANSHTVIATLRSIGFEATNIGIARDTKDGLINKLKEAMDYDIVIVSGGVSVGHHDFVRPTLKELGVTMQFWRVALRPGHPFAFGTGDNTLVFALPGNPVSSMVCTEQFIVPSLRKSSGAKKLFRPTVKATLKGDIKDRIGRLHFMRATVSSTDKGYEAELTGSQGSGILLSMVKADALIIVPEDKDKITEGSTVTVQLLYSNNFSKTSGLP